jgi:hypothetical protein
MLVERGTHFLRDACHLVEALRTADIEPVPDLLRAHLLLRRRNADRAKRLRKRHARQSDERWLCRRHVALERCLLDRDVCLKNGGHCFMQTLDVIPDAPSARLRVSSTRYGGDPESIAPCTDA